MSRFIYLMNQSYPPTTHPPTHPPTYLPTITYLSIGRSVRLLVCLFARPADSSTVTIVYYCIFVGRAAGLCDKMDLTAYKQHIFFLENKQEGQDYYMQTGEAVMYNRTIINTLIQTCNLEMNYPEGMCIIQLLCHCIFAWYAMSRSLVKLTEVGASWGRG